MSDGERTSRLEAVCSELLGLLKLQQGHVEVHSHRGEPSQLVIVDKSRKFGERKHS